MSPSGKKKKNREKIYAVIAILAIIVMLNIIINFGTITGQEGGYDRTVCPFKVEGNVNSSFTIKYIDSPYCMWCWFEKPILERLVANRGDQFKLEHYDIRYCDIAERFGLTGTPSFVFSINNGEKEFPHTGYIDEISLNRAVCEVIDCSK